MKSTFQKRPTRGNLWRWPASSSFHHLFWSPWSPPSIKRCSQEIWWPSDHMKVFFSFCFVFSSFFLIFSFLSLYSSSWSGSFLIYYPWWSSLSSLLALLWHYCVASSIHWCGVWPIDTNYSWVTLFAGRSECILPASAYVHKKQVFFSLPYSQFFSNFLHRFWDHYTLPTSTFERVVNESLEAILLVSFSFLFFSFLTIFLSSIGIWLV